MKKILLVSAVLWSFSMNAQDVSTFSELGGNAECICISPNGKMYATLSSNHLIKEIDSNGNASVFAGSGIQGSDDGVGAAASFNQPSGIVCDQEGNLYVADYGNYKIRKITPDGTVSTLAGSGVSGSANGTGTNAQFTAPWGICFAQNGDLLVTDQWSFAIRRITLQGEVTTFAQTGFVQLFGLCTDPQGNVYSAWTGGDQIFKFSADGLTQIVFAGTGLPGNTDGNGTSAEFNGCRGLHYGNDGVIYVSENGNQRIRKLTLNADVIHYAGDGGIACEDGPVAIASFWGPSGLVLNSSGELFVCDYFCNSVRKISASTSLASEQTPISRSIVYPNPSNGNATLLVDPVFLNGSISIFESCGMLIERNFLSKQQIEISESKKLPPGIYVVELKKGDFSEVLKLVVE